MKKLFSLVMAVMAVVVVNAATYTLTMSQYAATQFTAGNFALVCNKANATNNPPFTYNQNSSDIRVYAGGEVVITCSDTISKLVFSTSQKGQQQQATITPSTGSVKQSAGGKTITWIGVATTLTLSVGGSNDYGTDQSKGAGQFDFTAIEVTTGSNGSTSGGTTGGETGRTITINGLNYADVFFYSLFDENDMMYMELYADDDDVDYYPFVSLETETKSMTSLVGSYGLYWAGYWPTENDSVESDWDDMDPVGSLTISYANGTYTLSASWTGLDGNTYQFTCSPDLMAFDEDDKEITLSEPGTALNHVEAQQKAEKVIRNGHIVIRHGDAIYSVTGKRGE